MSIFIAGQAIAFEPDEAFPDVEQSTAMTTEELTQVFKGKKHLGPRRQNRYRSVEDYQRHHML